MAKRWFCTAVTVAATLIAGCSSHKTTVIHSSGASSPAKSTSVSTSAAATATSTEAPATESTPAAALDPSQCVDVTGAYSDLLTASDKDAARKAADTLEQYNPPASVKAAIEHFVGTGGIHFDDPDFPKNDKIAKEWVAQVCPT